MLRNVVEILILKNKIRDGTLNIHVFVYLENVLRNVNVLKGKNIVNRLLTKQMGCSPGLDYMCLRKSKRFCWMTFFFFILLVCVVKAHWLRTHVHFILTSFARWLCELNVYSCASFRHTTNINIIHRTTCVTHFIWTSVYAFVWLRQTVWFHQNNNYTIQTIISTTTTTKTKCLLW